VKDDAASVPPASAAAATDAPPPDGPSPEGPSVPTELTEQETGPNALVAQHFDLAPAAPDDAYGPRPDGAPTLTREQIVRFGLQNPLVEAAGEKINAMKVMAQKARWAWLPTVSARALLSPGVGISCEDVALTQANGESFDFQYCRPTGGEDLDVQTIGGYVQQLGEAGVAVSMTADAVFPITTFGKIKHVREMAKVGVAAAELEREATRLETIKRVFEAYAGLQLARESIRILDDAWDVVQGERGKIEKELGVGAGWDADPAELNLDRNPDDLLELEVGEIELGRRMREARKLESLALSALWMIAGRAAPSGFDIADETLRTDDVEGSLQPLSHYRSLALDSRPEANLARALVEVRRAQEKLARAQFFPDLGVVVRAGFGWASAAQIGPALYYTSRPNYSRMTAALALNWNLSIHNQVFDLQKARAESRQAEFQRDAAIALLQMEVDQAYRELVAARQDLELTDLARERAWQLVISQQQRATLGTGEFEKLQKALVRWAEFEFEHQEAIATQNTAIATLSRTVGTSLVAMNLPSAADPERKSHTALEVTQGE
jgi:outer membrane protein TolC